VDRHRGLWPDQRRRLGHLRPERHLGPYFSWGFAIGAWRPTGERTATGVEIYAIFSAPLDTLLDLSQPVPADALGQPPIRFRFDVEVGASGTTLASTGVVVDDEGKDDPSSPGTLTGIRLVPAAGSKATPAAPTATPPA